MTHKPTALFKGNYSQATPSYRSRPLLNVKNTTSSRYLSQNDSYNKYGSKIIRSAFRSSRKRNPNKKISFKDKLDQKIWSVNDFDIGRKLGRGKFGKVYLAREKKSSLLVAIKVLWKKQLSIHKMELQLRREIEILLNVNHPNMVRMFRFFHDCHRIYLVLEYCGGGELFNILRNAEHFSEKRTAKYILEVAKALDYCHEKHVIHRDIKPENLLLGMDDEIKLVDFGWAIHCPSIDQRRRQTMCGTIDYIPPEMIKREGYDPSVDIWALGILMFEFLNGNPPFECLQGGQMETFHKIQHEVVKYPASFSMDARDLISKLLKKDPEQRISLERVKYHPFIAKYYPVEVVNGKEMVE